MLTQHNLPDAEAQCQALAALIRPTLSPKTALVGIFSGGAWIAERLRELLNLPDEIGLIDTSFYRDDFAEKGLHAQVKPTHIPFDVEGRRLILVDDVLYTGRTTRAAINELFDYGRPAAIELAVLADRGQRELPIAPTYCVWSVSLSEGQSLVLSRDDHSATKPLSWRLEHA
jgi:pyrimidine operon attenuation protein / uracil phosphoribosyltransferase